MTVSNANTLAIQQHLNSLFEDAGLEPSTKVFNEFEDTLKFEDIDISIFTQLSPLIVLIIQSNETTAIAKDYAIKTLSILLPYYTFSQVKSIINDDLITMAFSGPETLQKVMSDLITRSEKGEINTDLLGLLFEILNHANDVGLVNSIENAIVHLVQINELGDTVCSIDVTQFYQNTLSYSRIISLGIRLLQFVPALPDNWYIVPEDRLVEYDDVMFLEYILRSTQTLITYIDEIDISSTIMKQIDWIAQMYIGENEKMKSWEGFCKYQIVDVLTTLAKVSPHLFNEVNSKYGLIEYSSDWSKDNTSYFLATIDPKYLRHFNVNLPLGYQTIDIFCNLISDLEILKKIQFKDNVLNKLTFEGIYKIFITLCKTKESMEIMVNRCPIILQMVIDSNVTNTGMFEVNLIDQSLDKLLNSGLDLGPLSDAINKKLNGEVSVMGPMTQTI